MEITVCTKEDFDSILIDYGDFWDHDRVVALHHPTLINEFGDSAFVMKEDGRIVAYLFGFLSQTGPVGYVQLIAVRQDCRRRGLAKALYAHFTKYALAHGCKQLKAITSTKNTLSIAFHRSIGMELLGETTETGVTAVRNYAGPGKHRVVFRKDIK